MNFDEIQKLAAKSMMDIDDGDDANGDDDDVDQVELMVGSCTIKITCIPYYNHHCYS